MADMNVSVGNRMVDGQEVSGLVMSKPNWLFLLLTIPGGCLAANIYHEYPGSESYVNIRLNDGLINFHNNYQRPPPPLSRPALRFESIPPHPPLPPIPPISSLYRHPAYPLHHTNPQALVVRHPPLGQGYQPLNQAYALQAHLVQPLHAPLPNHGYPYDPYYNPYFYPPVTGHIFPSPIFATAPESATLNPASNSTKVPSEAEQQERVTESATEAVTEATARPESKTKSSKRKPKTNEKLQDQTTEMKSSETTTTSHVDTTMTTTTHGNKKKPKVEDSNGSQS